MVIEQDKTLEALQMAIQMEIDGKEYYLKASQESSNELGKRLLQSLAAEEDIYKRQSQSAAYGAERDFYEALATQEREHHLILLDYYEYLKDPAAWFVTKEHSSLDGG